MTKDSASAPKESKPAGGKHGRPDAASSDVPQKADKAGKPKQGKKVSKGSGSGGKWLAIVVGVVAVAWGINRNKDALQVYLEPMVEPMVQNMPSVNMSALGLDRLNLPEFFQTEETPRPGLELKKKGYVPKHPIIIVPGFVTSGLELWQGRKCAAKYFRQRIWGSLSMTQSFMGDKACWLEHMALNATDGMDPEGVRLRASEGLFGVDYFFPGYAVWAKLIEAAADLGYDTNNLVGETYDWRLSVPNMEKRDRYFTRLKWRIELSHFTTGEKVVVASHSWGDNVFRNFLMWATEEPGADPNWAEEHIHAYINIAGPVLGVAKSITSLLSGETRDTAELGLIGAFLSDNLVPQNARVKLFRTWGSGIGMLPAGGPRIWGNATWAPDDTPDMVKANVTYGPLITETLIPEQVDEEPDDDIPDNSTFGDHIRTWLDKILAKGNHTNVDAIIKRHDVDSAVKILLKNAGPVFKEQVIKWGAVHAEKRSCASGKGSPEEYYFNPLKCPLPKAPSMEMYCLYGVGIPTERSYYYLNLESNKAFRKSESESKTTEQYEVRWKIDSEASGKKHGGQVDRGVRTSDGDGTVPLISTGALCAKHWREAPLNPSGLRVVSREYNHDPVALYKDLRGGPRSADHVDILGHMGVLTDVLKVASGRGKELEDDIISNVREIADKMDISEEDCCS